MADLLLLIGFSDLFFANLTEVHALWQAEPAGRNLRDKQGDIAF